MISRLGKLYIQVVNIIQQMRLLKVDCLWKMLKTKKA